MTTRGSAARNLERTKAGILAAATEHFARFGYYGARVDQIAEQTSTTKRMIYYCFGNKDGLFSACLHHAYAKIRDFEQGLHLADRDPLGAIDAYVRGTIQYHETHPELAKLVRGENLLEAVHLTADDIAANRAIVEVLDGVLERGRASGEFHADATGIQVHVAVTSLANYRITNESTIQALFGFSTREPERLVHDLDEYTAMVIGWLRSSAAALS
ncbi:MAG: TetR/AcrR family transcriptional regulator [Propioniciclava sp.]